MVKIEDEPVKQFPEYRQYAVYHGTDGRYYFQIDDGMLSVEMASAQTKDGAVEEAEDYYKELFQKIESAVLVDIQQLRQELDVSQQKFGDMFDIPKRTIQNWEYGESECPEYILAMLGRETYRILTNMRV